MSRSFYVRFIFGTVKFKLLVIVLLMQLMGLRSNTLRIPKIVFGVWREFPKMGLKHRVWRKKGSIMS